MQPNRPHTCTPQMAELLAALRRQKKQAKYDSAKLLEKDILDCFDATIGGRFHTQAELDEEIDDINEEWSNFTSAVNDAAKEHLGHKEETMNRLDLASIKGTHKGKKVQRSKQADKI